MKPIDFSDIDIKDMACFVFETLKLNGVRAILVGGACVSIYSNNLYQSYDLDFASYDDLKTIEKILKKFGFNRKGRCFYHHECPFIIDFVNPPIAIGNEPVSTFETLHGPMGSIQLLSPTDCVKDRLSAFFHWNDQQALAQAIFVAEAQSIVLENVQNWALGEGYLEKFKFFLARLKKGNYL